ncbi:MAG TPA: 3-isopropylmalate dehydratase small subunit [Acidocella sp.]|uniref:3-isopropylmalate dehydratase small subunit n=1 Tax=Acidocella sp. TaxID=50710 RepID=UPI002BC23706|nr:3-isopropylmalate dehydratase small subunit [Acidocella sp.]HVE23127.1 3-isopropylmalate dehydratase small subunit [Acidocella sp.]
MTPFTHLAAVAMPLARPNLDTDQIIPSRFLSRDRDDGTMGEVLFRDLRFTAEGGERPEFVLNQEPYRTAKIIVGERNFGCGSSREAAVWALYDYGFRAAIAPSFGDIFRNNCFKNGLLPVVLPREAVETLMAQFQAMPGGAVSIDLPAQIVTFPDGATHEFDIDPFGKECLVNGVDELGYTLTLRDQIAAFENRYGRTNA